MKKLDEKTYVLCNGISCECPVVKIEDGYVIITDDYNGKVKLTSEECLMLKSLLENVLLKK